MFKKSTLLFASLVVAALSVGATAAHAATAPRAAAPAAVTAPAAAPAAATAPATASAPAGPTAETVPNAPSPTPSPSGTTSQAARKEDAPPAATHVDARVLVECEFGKPNDLASVPIERVAELEASFAIDTHPAAVDFARRLAAGEIQA